MLAHHPHVRYRRLALVIENMPPALPPLAPAADVCGNCAGWCGFGSMAGGRCAVPTSPRFKSVVTRSVSACGAFARASQLKLAV